MTALEADKRADPVADEDEHEQPYGCTRAPGVGGAER
jgi:hypothetical protein